MAEFFKKIGQGVSVATKNVKESIDISKKRCEIKKQMNEADDKIEKLKLSIGESVYERYKNGTGNDSCIELCKEIDSTKAQMIKLEAQLLELDGIKLCEKCGTKIPLDAVFCSKCGERQYSAFDTDVKSDSENSQEDNMISL